MAKTGCSFHFTFATNPLFTNVNPPVGWGSTYCFTAVGIGVFVGVRITPITKGPPAQIFLGWHVFCYDLDIWGQGQALRAFFVVMSFFTILSKV